VIENLSEEKDTPLIVTTFYHFFTIENLVGLQRRLLRFCKMLNINGTLLIAEEGINATMAGARESIDSLYEYLKRVTDLEAIEYKESISYIAPFEKLKVKIRPEIVTMGIKNIDVANNRGKYIEAQKWDEFISRDDVVLIDTRNQYETRIGTFEGAIDPETNNFREFPEWAEKNSHLFKDKKVAMFCTGGVRCEKSTAFLKEMGIEEVYHLKGGIVKYIEEKKGETNHKWKGRCFIFDDRVSLDNDLNSSAVMCEVCSEPINTQELKHIRSQGILQCLKCIET
jgi:UPF0176 protein